jgi:hypothetical protein
LSDIGNKKLESVASSSIDNLDKISKMRVSSSDLADEIVKDKTLDSLLKKETLDKLDSLLSRKHPNAYDSPVSELDLFLDRKNNSNASVNADTNIDLKDINKNSTKTSDGLISNGAKNMFDSFAQGLSSGMNFDIFKIILKKLYSEGKINKDDLKNMLMELLSRNLIKDVDYVSLCDELGIK